MIKHQWYTVRVKSGSEKSIIEEIKYQAKLNSVDELISDIAIPIKESISFKQGKKVNTAKNIAPGYIFIKMLLSDKLISCIRNIPRVSKFLADSSGCPSIVSEKEIHRLISMIKNSKDDKSYNVGNEVKIIDGPFMSFTGIVEEVDEEKGRVKVKISIFGTSTLLELTFDEIEKIDDKIN